MGGDPRDQHNIARSGFIVNGRVLPGKLLGTGYLNIMVV